MKGVKVSHGHDFISSKNNYQMIMVFHAPLDNRVILELTLMCSSNHDSRSGLWGVVKFMMKVKTF